jgi:peptidoglycan/LPS O-acetylase OafA/YrhL
LSDLPFRQYFGIGFWKYLGANLVFLNFLAPSLPGVFTANLVPMINGALWTLKIEVAFYLFVPVLHWLCRRFGTRTTAVTVFALSCLWRYGFAWLAYIHRPVGIHSGDAPRTIYEQLEVQFPAQLGYFIAGVLLLIYFDKLKRYFAAIAGLTVCLFVLDHWLTGEYLDVLWISGVVIVFGFWRYLGNFARYGDFSYGLYIVHWPILQILIALGLARLNPALFLLSALSIILAAAFLMWHLVESRFLASSSHYRQSVVAPSESS